MWWSSFDTSLLRRDPLVLSTSCCSCWRTSATTSPSCRKRCSGTGLTLQQRSSRYLRNFPALQRPWTSALEMTTPKELRQETWEPTETSILSTRRHLHAKGRAVFACSEIIQRTEQNTTGDLEKIRSFFLFFKLFSFLLRTSLIPNTIFRLDILKTRGRK